MVFTIKLGGAGRKIGDAGRKTLPDRYIFVFDPTI